MSAAREAILGRIRAATADLPAAVRAGEAPVPREYRRRGDLDPARVAELFAARVADYRAGVRRVAPGEVASALAEACRRRGTARLAVAEGVPADWRPAGVELLAGMGRDHAALDAVDGALTGCALGIAETGTIVLDGGPRCGPRAITLVPDYHLCVVEEAQLVQSVPEAIAALHEAARAGRPITFVSGPSATSDIELRRVEGVHGPRTLEVLLVAPAPGDAPAPAIR